ncbi:MAG: YhbY family RNA-binding protein [Candidatus Asgardarchaeia archaeon]
MKEKIQVVRVGKNGLEDNVIKEIKRQLKEKRVVKIKFMRNIVSDKEEFNKLVKELLSKLENVKIEKQIGHTIVLRL